MTTTPVESRPNVPAKQAPSLSPVASYMRAKRLREARHFRPGRRRPGVSGYRVFMRIVFVCVVLVDVWSDQSLSADVVGRVSVVVWALTLLGGFGIGPIATIWDAVRR